MDETLLNVGEWVTKGDPDMQWKFRVASLQPTTPIDGKPIDILILEYESITDSIGKVHRMDWLINSHPMTGFGIIHKNGKGNDRNGYPFLGEPAQAYVGPQWCAPDEWVDRSPGVRVSSCVLIDVSPVSSQDQLVVAMRYNRKTHYWKIPTRN